MIADMEVIEDMELKLRGRRIFDTSSVPKWKVQATVTLRRMFEESRDGQERIGWDGKAWRTGERDSGTLRTSLAAVVVGA
jgi:hypothetical protein